MDSEKKLAEMTQQMEQLLSEKKDLEVKNRILERDLVAWQDHLEEMWGNKVRSSAHMQDHEALITNRHSLLLNSCIGLVAHVLWQYRI